MKRLAGWILALAAAGNAVAVVLLWGAGGVRDIHDTASLLTAWGG